MIKISPQTICLTDFETSQTKATLASHCPTDWTYFEHCRFRSNPNLNIKHLITANIHLEPNHYMWVEASTNLSKHSSKFEV